MLGPSRKRLRTLEHPSTSYDNFDAPEEEACGIIESVTMKNFMCHEHLSATFTDRINLVQGRNGSGKSAILTAVVVALGGSTRTTNRGSNLKELIKYDKHAATVQVVIKNSGKDSFKYESYGNNITVERKISEAGPNSYSLKASNGRIVSTKKDELKCMCDFFNLNVENPLTVLNQDMSRSFLNSTDPRNLYKFFFQATQLQQMSDYYTQLNDCLDTSKNIIKDRMAFLPMIDKDVQELGNRYQFCLKQTDKRKKLKELRRELAWATISELETGKEAVEKELNESLAVYEKLEAKQSTFKAQSEQSKQKHKAVENEFHSLSEEIKKHRMNYNLKKEETLKVKARWKDAQREVDKETRRIETINKEIAGINETIKKDHTEAQQAWEEQHKQHQEEMQATQAQISEIEQTKKTEETHLMNIQNTIKMKLESRQQLKFEENNKMRHLQDLQTDLKNLQSQNTNGFTVFGQWVQQLLDRIDQAFRQKKFSARPVGPLGAFIEMRDSKWTHIAEMVIGGRISAFCVNKSQDEKVLRGLFNGIHFGGQQPMIICCRFRPRHDAGLIARNEVHSDTYPSLWSVMNIKDDVVANLIIDRSQVETVLLIQTAEEAGQILKNANTVPRNCKIAYTLNGDKYFPDPNYKVYSGLGQKRARFLQISVGERAQEVANDIAILKREIEGLKEEMRNFDVEIRELKGQENASLKKMKIQKDKFHTLQGKLSQLTNQVAPLPPNISQLEEELRGLEATRAKASEKLNAIQEEQRDLERECKEAQEAFNEFNSSFSSLRENAFIKEKEMQEAEEMANKQLHSSDVLKQKLKTHEKKKKELENKLKEELGKLEREIKMAENFLPRWETTRTPVEIERQYKNLEVKLTREQEQRGDPVEIAVQYKDMQAKFMKMKGELEASRNLVSKLEKSLRSRWNMGKNFRKTLSILVKTSFSEALTSRTLKGKILFDFEKESLSIHVMKEDGITDLGDLSSASQKKMLKKSQQEKLSMMSGGERSFATVALILALWEVMDSPIRILDEFDVFMDIIARRQSLDMMISAAKPKTQYIYLTPLEVNQNQHKTELNIFRMPDPERQNTAETSE